MKRARAILVVQDDVQQGRVHLDVAVIANESELAETVHEEADARPRGANHLGQCFLTNLRDGGCGLTRLTELRKKQKDSGETLFAGIEELIHQIFLNTHGPREQEADKDIRECVLLVDDANHLFSSDLEDRARSYRGSRRHSESIRCWNRIFPEEFTGVE